MNRKTMQMLYGSSYGGPTNGGMSNVTDIRSARRNGRGQYMSMYGQGVASDAMIGFGEQDRYNTGMRYNQMTDEGVNPYGGDPYHQQGSHMTMGHTQASQQMGMGVESIEEYLEKPLTISEAMQWAECLEGGPHWKQEEVKQYAEHVGMKTSGAKYAEFYAWMNALYCDYKDTLKKYGMDRPEVYADLAKATMEDDDAVENKGAVYYRFIVDCD